MTTGPPTNSLGPKEARRRFGAARSARLATASRAGVPHLVPVVFALAPVAADGLDTVYSAVDHKPKRTTSLRRLGNVAANPAVCLLVDHYEEDWDHLWWVRADGRARVVAPDARDAGRALDLLEARYPQYRGRRPAGPILVVEITRWSGWTARA